MNIKKTTKKQKQVNGDSQSNGHATEPSAQADKRPDVQMSEAPLTEHTGTGEVTTQVAEVKLREVQDTEDTYEADPDDEDGAVWPIVNGRIVDWHAFFALLDHVRTALNPHLHSPLVIQAGAAWGTKELEAITQFVFEKWSVPVYIMMDNAICGTYAYGIATGLVVDIGLDKCDVSAVVDWTVNDAGRSVSSVNCGGRSMTKRLQEALMKEGIDATEPMAEQLKMSSICEILPLGVPLPTSTGASGEVANPAAAASTGAVDSGPNAKEADGSKPGSEPRGPGAGTQVGEEADDDNEGVFDVASIVAQDNAAELLAKREAEKAAKAAAKKGAAADGARQARLRNSEKATATFTYEESFHAEEDKDGEGVVPLRKRKREVEVGTARFMAATPGEREFEGLIDTIVRQMHGVVSGVSDISMRSTLWENIIIMGNGSRVKGELIAQYTLRNSNANSQAGFKEALIANLQGKYVLSPSTTTMFTSELPSNFTTPVGTPGTNTPIPGQTGHSMHHPGGSGVNPLLVAATRNVMQPTPGQHLQIPGHATPIPMDPNTWQATRGYSQSPHTVKLAKVPDYMPEMKDPLHSGWEDAAFVGLQAGGKLVFILEVREKDFMSRQDYNDSGPSEIMQYTIGI